MSATLIDYKENFGQNGASRRLPPTIASRNSVVELNESMQHLSIKKDLDKRQQGKNKSKSGENRKSLARGPNSSSYSAPLNKNHKNNYHAVGVGGLKTKNNSKWSIENEAQHKQLHSQFPHHCPSSNQYSDILTGAPAMSADPRQASHMEQLPSENQRIPCKNNHGNSKMNNKYDRLNPHSRSGTNERHHHHHHHHHHQQHNYRQQQRNESMVSAGSGVTALNTQSHGDGDRHSYEQNQSNYQHYNHRGMHQRAGRSNPQHSNVNLAYRSNAGSNHPPAVSALSPFQFVLNDQDLDICKQTAWHVNSVRQSIAVDSNLLTHLHLIACTSDKFLLEQQQKFAYALEQKRQREINSWLSNKTEAERSAYIARTTAANTGANSTPSISAVTSSAIDSTKTNSISSSSTCNDDDNCATAIATADVAGGTTGTGTCEEKKDNETDLSSRTVY